MADSTERLLAESAKIRLRGGAGFDPVTLGCGIAGLRSLRAGSVDLVLSDLPSGETKASFDVKPDLLAMWTAIWGALAPAGSVVLMASSLRFAAEIIASCEPRSFRYDLVWSKSVATGFLNARKRPLRAHEYILFFSREPGVYTPQMATGATPIHAARRKATGRNYNEAQSMPSRAGATDRWPTSVLEFGSVGTSSAERTHPQQKPVDLLRWIIRTYSAPGALIADPFAGSGSTGRAAAVEGRRFVGWDSDPEFGIDSGSEVQP